MTDRISLQQRLQQQQQHIHPSLPAVSGHLVRVVGLTLEATGCRAAIGQPCLVESASGAILAEVVGFANDRLFLMPQDDIAGVVPGVRLTPVIQYEGLPLTLNLLGLEDRSPQMWLFLRF